MFPDNAVLTLAALGIVNALAMEHKSRTAADTVSLTDIFFDNFTVLL